MNQKGPIFLHLDIVNYKTIPCQVVEEHNTNQCFNYHNDFEKRRSPKQFMYSQTACKQKDNCKYGDKCDKSHSYFEQIYHPRSYKKKYCKNFMAKGDCLYGKYCAFAHSDEELKIKNLHKMKIDIDFLLFHFKSEFCPFQKIEHDKFSCVYAHNYQDYKRPFFNNLKDQSCPNWNNNKEINQYENGCINGMQCQYCHGWKELEFHTNNFLKFKCKKKKCKNKNICPFYHKKQKLTFLNKSSFTQVQPYSKFNKNNSQLLDYLQQIDTQIPSVYFNSLQNCYSQESIFHNQNSTQTNSLSINDTYYTKSHKDLNQCENVMKYKRRNSRIQIIIS